MLLVANIINMIEKSRSKRCELCELGFSCGDHISLIYLGMHYHPPFEFVNDALI